MAEKKAVDTLQGELDLGDGVSNGARHEGAAETAKARDRPKAREGYEGLGDVPAEGSWKSLHSMLASYSPGTAGSCSSSRRSIRSTRLSSWSTRASIRTKSSRRWAKSTPDTRHLLLNGREAVPYVAHLLLQLIDLQIDPPQVVQGDVLSVGHGRSWALQGGSLT